MTTTATPGWPFSFPLSWPFSFPLPWPFSFPLPWSFSFPPLSHLCESVATG